MIFLTMPNKYSFVVIIADTSAAVLDCIGSAITHLVYRSVMVRTYLLLHAVSGSGPIKSNPSTSQGSFTCMAQNNHQPNAGKNVHKVETSLLVSSVC